MNFGITIKPVISPDRVVSLMHKAETVGFEYGWLYDSHILRMEPYPLLTMIALNTKQTRLGTCVTNPLTRHPSVTASAIATLNLISNGRMVLGIGRGDASLRMIGEQPASLTQLTEAIRVIKGLTMGSLTDYRGQTVQLKWAAGELPVWIAGYGPKVLHMAGRLADGVILQFADPSLISWCLNFVREGIRAAGRDPSSIQVMAAAPVWISDDRTSARERLRWFPSVVSNHVVELIRHYGLSKLPAELTEYVRNRYGYDYHQHGNVGSSNATFVPDEVVDRFCIIGSVKEHQRRLKELADVGVHQFNLYLMNGDEEQTLDIYGREIVPSLSHYNTQWSI